MENRQQYGQNKIVHDKDLEPNLQSSSDTQHEGGRQRLHIKRSLTLVSRAAALLAALRLLFWASGDMPRQMLNVKHPYFTTELPEQRHYLVLPATEANSAFCRTLFSLLINGYDPPIIVNWGNKSLNTVNIFHNGPATMDHYNKITGFLSWLKTEQGRPDDIVAMVDAFDVWAQMPPQIFFQQYKSYPDSKPSQFPGIVTGADKRCAPGWRIAPRCAKMPKSPLPDDTYGKLTDGYNKAFREDFMPSTEFGRNYRHNKLDTVRPRYINSGTVIGSRKGLRELYSAMSAKMDLVLQGQLKVTRIGSDQELMGLANLDTIVLGDKRGIQPDGRSLLFQVAAYSYRDLMVRKLSNAVYDMHAAQQGLLKELVKEDKQWTNRNIVYNHIARAVPSFLHFAGPDLDDRTEPWWNGMWWMQPSKQQEHGGGTYAEAQLRPKRPVESFWELLEQQAEESERFGHGARLANGTWMGYMEMCAPYKQFILGQTAVMQ